MLLLTLVFFAAFGMSVYSYIKMDNPIDVSEYSLEKVKEYNFVGGKIAYVAGDATGVTFKATTDERVKILNRYYKVYTIQLGVKAEPEKERDIYQLHDVTPTPVPDAHEQFEDYTPEYMTLLVSEDDQEDFEKLTNQVVKGRLAEFSGLVVKNPVKLDYDFLKSATKYDEDWKVKKYVCGDYTIVNISKSEMLDVMLVTGILFIVFLGISVWLGIKAQK